MNSEARNILNIYHFYKMDTHLYLSATQEQVDDLFSAVVQAIDASTLLKPTLPYNEFVLPSRKLLEGDSGWVGHFEERDNRRFFLSDVYDYLRLFCRKSA